MKITGKRINRHGKEVLTVEIDAGEQLMAFRDDRFYRLGEPLDEEIVYGHNITGAREVEWCTVSQKWIR